MLTSDLHLSGHLHVLTCSRPDQYELPNIWQNINVKCNYWTIYLNQKYKIESKRERESSEATERSI